MGPSKLSTNQTFLNLEPAEQLPVYDLANVPVNFEATIENVADMGSSYKNRAEFYINDHLIVPDQEITNVQNVYTYRMKLQPGIYNIKGRYLALDGFSERKFEIKPQTKVMIKPDTKTKAYYKIEKKWDGTPLHNKMIFNVTYEPFSPKTTAVEKIVEEKPAPPQVVQQFPRRFRENQFPRQRRFQEPPPRETSRNMIVLQIKTVPSGADVIIDDEFIGKSPIRILVDKNKSHEMQISKEGYLRVIKEIDRSQFGSEKVMHFLQKLSPRY